MEKNKSVNIRQEYAKWQATAIFMSITVTEAHSDDKVAFK